MAATGDKTEIETRTTADAEWECTGCGYGSVDEEDFRADETSRCPACGDCAECCWENHGGDDHAVVV